MLARQPTQWSCITPVNTSRSAKITALNVQSGNVALPLAWLQASVRDLRSVVATFNSNEENLTGSFHNFTLVILCSNNLSTSKAASNRA